MNLGKAGKFVGQVSDWKFKGQGGGKTDPGERKLPGRDQSQTGLFIVL